MITHHPGEDLLALYAAGSLDEANSLAIVTHLTLCPACRAVCDDFEALGGALMDENSADTLKPDALAGTLGMIREARSEVTAISVPQRSAAPTAGASILPLPLQYYVGGDLAVARWRTLGPGIHHMPLITDGAATARLLRIAPGRSVFEHSHAGNEITIVLRGSYSAGGEEFRRGDLEMADGSVSHRPIAGSEDICVCLAVTDAPLRFGNWIGRLMQPFIGI
ncbi:ChrR family anti-sigma-E factor [Dongia sp.]|uniref:ChrR family anti-sigma-E factor n=1 Tax=Dongia sp. TaxID=1977262 RepID=UPI0035B213BD